jgi:hypothetical protein
MPRSDAVRSSDGVSILPGTVDDQDSFEFGLQKFVEEARVLARISEKDNPRIVSIHGFFKANGTAYLVMRYLEGQTLSGLLKSKGGSLPENEAIVILTAMLDGLREIHSAGLIHRDIKPQNVFITNDGGIKLIDFGAARYAQGAQSRGLTQVFTPPYAPSEQYSLRGDQGPWTDIYAVAFFFDSTDTVRAEVIKQDPILDLALLKLEDFQSREHPPLPLYCGKTVYEELTVWVLGFPGVDLVSVKALSEAAARKGNVSKLTEDKGGRKVLQVNTDINHGNSGGPVLDDCGRVIGVATFKYSGDGETTGFAVSYEELRKFLDRFPDVKPTWDKSECSTSALQGMALVVGVIFLAIVLAAIGIIIALKHKEKIASTFSRSLRLPAPKPVAKPIQAPALEPVAALKPAPAPEPVASQFTLVGTAGPLTGSQFPLSAKALFVGRDPDTSNIVLPPDTQGVSRRHFEIFVGPDGVKIRDNYSSYGTFVDGSKIDSGVWVPVQKGQVVTLGGADTAFTVR